MLWSHTLKEVPDVPTTILVFMMVSIFHIAISCVAITLNDPTIKVLIQSMINKAWPKEKELHWVHPRFCGGFRFTLRDHLDSPRLLQGFVLLFFLFFVFCLFFFGVSSFHVLFSMFSESLDCPYLATNPVFSTVYSMCPCAIITYSILSSQIISVYFIKHHTLISWICIYILPIWTVPTVVWLSYSI